MKVNLGTKHIASDDILFMLTNIFRNVILKEFGDVSNEEISQKLKEVYSVIEEDEPILPVEPEHNISTLLYYIETSHTDLYLNSVLYAARKQGLDAIPMLVALFSRNQIQHKFGEIHVIEKDSIPFFIECIEKGIEEGIFDREKPMSIADTLSVVLSDGKEKSIEKENPLITFLKELKQESDPDYITVVSDDYYLDVSTQYRNNFNIDYRKIIFSSDFKEWVEKEDVSNTTFEDDFTGLVDEYLEETEGFDFQDLIVQAILNNKEKYGRHIINEQLIKNIAFGKDDSTIFDEI